MSTNPDQSRQHQAELATALLLIGRRYNLPALIRANHVRTRPFRQIRPTEALRSSLAAPYMDLVRAWAEQRPALMAAYEQAARSGDLSIIRHQVEVSAADVERQLAAIQQRFPRILADIERWHRGQWLQRIKTSTGLDVGMFTSAADVAADSRNAVTWNQQLLGDVHSQTKGGISLALLAGAAVSAPAMNAAINGALGKAKKRGLAIGVDQTNRTVASMTRSRRDAAGLTSFIWHHSPHVRFPRPEHVARDGKTFTERNAPNDRAGLLFGCQCWEEPTFD